VVFIAVVGAWLLFAPIAAWAVGVALRLAERAERRESKDDEGHCPPDAEAGAAEADSGEIAPPAGVGAAQA
jgi:hypothetical protein